MEGHPRNFGCRGQRTLWSLGSPPFVNSQVILAVAGKLAFSLSENACHKDCNLKKRVVSIVSPYICALLLQPSPQHPLDHQGLSTPMQLLTTQEMQSIMLIDAKLSTWTEAMCGELLRAYIQTTQML
jgi:hypothetical protein